MSYYNSGNGYSNSYGSNRYGNSSTSTGYGNHPHAYKESLKGRDYINPDKDPHQHWRENYLSNDDQKSGLSAIFMHWAIQRIEEQIQYLAASRADVVGGTSAVVSDVTFRWIGLKNLATVGVSLLSFIAGLVVYVVFSLTLNNIIFSYAILFIFLSHSLFPGYVITRMKRFVIGDLKTGKLVKKVRHSWTTFEIIYLAITMGIFYIKDKINWVELKVDLLAHLSKYTILKRFLYQKINSIQIENMPNILEHCFIVLIISAIFYIIMIYATSKKSLIAREKLENDIKKQYMRPAQILKEKNKRGGAK